MFINCSLTFWLVSFTTVLDLAGHAALIVLYSQLQNKYETVDIPMYEYLRDNQCTDGALARGIEQILNSFAKDKRVTSVGLAFALASAAASFFIFTCTSKGIRNCLGGCCACFSTLKETP